MVIFDQMYQVDTGIGVNGLVQSLDILGECGHYDHDLFPWHAMMIDKLSEDLNELACSLSVNKKIDLIIGLSRIPVRPVIDLVNDLLKTVSNEEFATIVRRFATPRKGWKFTFLRDTDMLTMLSSWKMIS